MCRVPYVEPSFREGSCLFFSFPPFKKPGPSAEFGVHVSSPLIHGVRVTWIRSGVPGNSCIVIRFCNIAFFWRGVLTNQNIN